MKSNHQHYHTHEGAQHSGHVGHAHHLSNTEPTQLPFELPNQSIPIEIGQFLWNLVYQIITKDYNGLKNLHDLEFNTLSEQFYATKPWLNINLVQQFYRHNNCYHELIVALYVELSYRHMFARCKASLTFEERQGSWKNYLDIFNYFHDEECKASYESDKSLLLPEQWFWDIHDELIYQFQDTCHWKASFAKKLPEDKTEQLAILEILQANQGIWSAGHVFQLLHQIVSSSGIHEYLMKSKTESNHTPMDVPRLLGYFSLISLMRLYTITGEYTLAVELAQQLESDKNVQDMESSPKHFYTKILTCYSCYVYHLAFSYIMLRKFTEATRLLSQFLIHCLMNRSQTQSSSAYPGAISKQIDRMYMLLMICDMLSPTRLDDILLQSMKDKHSDKYNKMSLENIDLVSEILSFAQPKFINPAFSKFEKKEELILYAELEKEKMEYPFQLICKEMQLQRRINEIFSYASFYHNIGLSKLASLMDMNDKNAAESIRDELLSIKQKSLRLVTKQGPHVGEYIATKNQFDFYLDGDVMHIMSPKLKKSYAQDFLDALNWSQDFLTKIHQSPRAIRDGETSKHTTHTSTYQKDKY